MADLSRKKLKKMASEEAKRTVQAAETWTNLMAAVAPADIRLSVHPQRPGAEKVGIFINDNVTGWASPWNATAIEVSPGHWTLCYPGRLQNESLDSLCEVVPDSNGQPNHLRVKPDCSKQEKGRLLALLKNGNS